MWVFPHRARRLDSHHILQAELDKIHPKLRIHSVAGVGHHHTLWNSRLDRLSNLFQELSLVLSET